MTGEKENTAIETMASIAGSKTVTHKKASATK